MRNIAWRLMPVMVFIVLSICLWRGLHLDPHKLPSTLLNKPMPAFQLPLLLEPQKIISQRDWQGTPAIINVWASWCVSCIAEHAILMQLARQHSLVIYGLNYKDEPLAAKQWLQERGNPYNTIVMDRAGKMAIDWGVYGTPETFVIDAQGYIRYKHVGVLTMDVWRKQIVPLFKQLKSQSVVS